MQLPPPQPDGPRQRPGESSRSAKRVDARRSRKIRFVPAGKNSLFSADRPFHAILKDTGDPRIKTLRLETEDGELLLEASGSIGERSAEWSLPDAAERDARGAHPEREVLDRVMYRIIEASVLLLDEADERQREAVFRVIHHALGRLVEMRRRLDGGERGSSVRLRQELSGLLQDLQNLRIIAEDEERRP